MASIFGGERPRLAINYTPHDGQKEVSKSIRENFTSATPAAIVEIICGRGWGKTLYLGCSVLAPFLEQFSNARVMWVGPSYLHCMSLIDDVFKGTNEVTQESFVPEFDERGRRVWEFVTTKSGPILKWHNGATVTFRSADSPDSIVSKGFNLIIIDECCLIPDESIFTQQILGTARKQGVKIFMISTPRGKAHWTYKYFEKGQDPSDTMYLSFQQPYTKNPHYSKVLAALAKDIPEWMFRQEYLAEFIEDGDVVFKGLHDVMQGLEISYESQAQEWQTKLEDITIKRYDGTDLTLKSSDRRFVVGLDLAKSKDYTVLWGMDLDTGESVYYKRFNKTDYRDVLKIATRVCKELNGADLIFDATGVGSGLADMFNDYDVVAHPFVFTNESKNEIVNRLALSIEHQEVKIPNIKTVKKELAIFTYTITRTGKISYGAPAGDSNHDDIVMAMALANWYRKENQGNDEITVVEEIIAANESQTQDFRPGSYEEFLNED